MTAATPLTYSSRLRLGARLQRWASLGWIPHLAALGSAGAYGLQAWGHSTGQASVLDEGLYLYKGLLFATGRYWPFQEFGPWTNHMPLAFLIPGWVQLVAGPGLRTGRLYALALAALFLLAVWILARRLGGRWMAATALFTLAANPFLIKIYSQAISQVLVAATLAWALGLTLGENRRLWETTLGGALAGLLVMTRVNLSPALPLLLAYVFWQHGRRAGLYASGVGLGVVVLGHALFWPGILKLWAYWLPPSLTSFLDPWRELSGGQPYWQPQISVASRVVVFFGALRRNLFPVLGVLLAISLWPGRAAETRSQRRGAILLVALFASLLSVHAWAALTQDYCVFCLSPYTAFFSFSGILLLALAVGRWAGRATTGRRVFVGILGLLPALWATPRGLRLLASQLTETQLPRMRELRLLPGSASVEVLLHNRFGIAPESLNAYLTTALSLWLVLLGAGGALLLASLLSRSRRTWAGKQGVRWFAGGLALWFAALSLAHGNRFTNYDCGVDVIAGYERVGAHLRQLIPPGSRLYWAGGLSPVPLLYLPQAQIFPAQLNGDYSFRIGGDPASLERFGFWNAELAQDWLGRADYALVEQAELSGWLAEAVGSSDFEELPPTPPALGCRADSWIHVYRRTP